MAETSEWCAKLNHSALFDALRKNAHKLKDTLQAKSIIALSDGQLYVWDCYSVSLLATNLKSLNSQSASNRSIYQVKPQTSYIVIHLWVKPFDPKL